MAAYAFGDVSGTTIASFDPASDTLVFSTGFRPASLQLTASGADTIVAYSSASVTLAGIAPGDLDGLQFIFADGSVFRQGSAGNDSIEGTAGPDAFDLQAGGSDTVWAGAENDVFRLGATLDAMDSIDGGTGYADELHLAGNITVVFGETTVRAVEKFVLGTGGTVQLQLHEGMLAGVGSDLWFDARAQTAGDAVLVDGSGMAGGFIADGGAGKDTLLGGAGADTFDGAGGDNLLVGGGGNDWLAIESGHGTSTLLGGLGNDRLDASGGSSGNVLEGGRGSDSLTGGYGNDVLRAAGAEEAGGATVADAASDTNYLSGGDGHDTLWGSAGLDTLWGGSGNDLLDGSLGADSLYGQNGADTLLGGNGADSLDGGLGADLLEGGEGDDTYRVDDAGDVVTEAAGGGIDKVMVDIGSYTLADEVENASFVSLSEYDLDAVQLTGNALDNSLQGGYGDDTLAGGGGNDTLYGSLGANRLIGGRGDDTYDMVRPGDTVIEGADAGFDTVIVWGSSYVLEKNVEAASLTWAGKLEGNALDNLLIGGEGSAVTLSGGAGNDTLQAGDTYYGGILIGGVGNDTYLLGSNYGYQVVESAAVTGGVDLIVTGQSHALGAGFENLTLTGNAEATAEGNALANVLRGNDAGNVLIGNGGADTLVGGGGDDLLYVEADDVVVEAADGGKDSVVIGSSYTLGANVENLTLTGSAQTKLTGRGNGLANQLYGHDGINRLDGRAGADTMRGYEGDDTYVVDDAADVVIEDGLNWGGIDNVQSSVSYVLGTSVEHLVLTGTAAISGTGNNSANQLRGNAGNNTLDGGGNDDTLNGGTGADRLIGGKGDDTYHVDRAGDVVVEAGGAESGVDLVVSLVSRTLGDYQENLTLGGTSNIRATGNTQANKLTGNAGANRLDGGAGADTMAGGLGNDTYLVDSQNDVVMESSTGGIDTVLASTSFAMGEWVENMTLTGDGAISGTGNAIGNRITGNAAANQLDGGAGVDTLVGGLGDDTYVVDRAADVVVERAGGGVDTIVSSVSLALRGNQENLTLTGEALEAKGNELANWLTGNGMNNTLNGSTGADTMEGGHGDDIYIVDNVGDVVVEYGSFDTGTDTLISRVNWVLGADQEILMLAGRAITATGNDIANGLAGNGLNNVLDGREGDDLIVGGAGNDTLIGGWDADLLEGGAGSDRFVFHSVDDSNLVVCDLISDFTAGVDKIDLSQFDTPGGRTFQFTGEGVPTGELQLGYLLYQGLVILYGNVDVDSDPDFAVVIDGVTKLTASDLIL